MLNLSDEVIEILAHGADPGYVFELCNSFLGKNCFPRCYFAVILAQNYWKPSVVYDFWEIFDVTAILKCVKHWISHQCREKLRLHKKFAFNFISENRKRYLGNETLVIHLFYHLLTCPEIMYLCKVPLLSYIIYM